MYESEILEVYQYCDIRSFPVDCDSILRKFGYEIITYKHASNGSDIELQRLKSISKDGFIVRREEKLYLNDELYKKRILFTKAHEIGHLVTVSDDEDTADIFASNLLAPRPIVKAFGFRTADEISDFFEISITAANKVIYNMRDFMVNYDVERIWEWFGFYELVSSSSTKSDDISSPTFWSPIGKYVATQKAIPASDKANRTIDKDRKIYTQKKIRSLKGKITRLRASMTTMTLGDEERYADAEKKLASLLRELRYVTGDKEYTW